MTHGPRGQNSFGQRMSGVSEASGSQVQLGWNQTLELSDLAQSLTQCLLHPQLGQPPPHGYTIVFSNTTDTLTQALL